MLVVMLMLLMITATAYYSIRSTAFELRAATYQRQALQTDYVAETALNAATAWVDFYGPASLLFALQESVRLRQAGGVGMVTPPEPFEVPLLPGRESYRLGQGDFVGMTATTEEPIELAAFGDDHAYQPFYVIDVYDHYVSPVVQGGRADGLGQLQFLNVTLTARGRTRLPVDTQQSVNFDSDGDGADDTVVRFAHEGASDARAHGFSGPFAR
ncbi:MAG: hypothetical protein AAF355_03425 [Myxococcota bacterium]